MPNSYQIALGDAEKTRLVNRIEEDFGNARTAHFERLEKFRGYLQKWENRVSAPKPGDEELPNHTVPITQWTVFNKWARDLQALIGDDAEITARPTGPSDADKAAKVGAYMTSRLFDQMEILNPLAHFQFMRILYGRAIAYRPWYTKEIDWLENGKRSRKVIWDGPGFFPQSPDSIVVPGERGVTSIQDFSYVIRRVPVTVDFLQRKDGTLFQGTSDREFVEKAIKIAQTGYDDSSLTDDKVRKEAERAEGVDLDTGSERARRTLWMWEWFGHWRPLKRRLIDGDQDDLTKRRAFEADWVIRYIPGMQKIVGCQDLLELYPRMTKRRPFSESSLIKDGSYWCKGFGALLEMIEDEATANSRLFTAAGELCVWPIIFYKPGAGMNPKVMKLGPGLGIPTEDPAGVNVVRLIPNMDYAIAKQQDSLANAERVTGISDQSLGRGIDRPNAPRTATGQLALIEEGNVRAYLDGTVLREDMEALVSEIWEMDCDLLEKKDPGLWFRVTESTDVGTAGFDTAKGGAYMTPEEFAGKYDFRLKFATSAWSREAQAQKVISFYQAAMTNPLVLQNPRALWVLLNRLSTALGIKDFSNIIPQPPDLDEPISPDQEWTKMLEGDDEVQPNPLDHDNLHLSKHMKQLAESRQDPHADIQARNLLIKHIQETRAQMASKQAIAALTSSLIQSIQPGGGPQQVPPGMPQPGMPQPSGAPPGGAPPGVPPPNGTPGVPPMPSEQVGSSAAPVPHDGMM